MGFISMECVTQKLNPVAVNSSNPTGYHSRLHHWLKYFYSFPFLSFPRGLHFSTSHFNVILKKREQDGLTINTVIKSFDGSNVAMNKVTWMNFMNFSKGNISAPHFKANKISHHFFFIKVELWSSCLKNVRWKIFGYDLWSLMWPSWIYNCPFNL